jgi:hypothetical protein
MKNLLSIAIILFSIQSHAELIIDGHTAFCEDKIDVIRSLRSNVYRFEKPSIDTSSETITVSIDVEFLHCVESNNTFNFVTVVNHMTASYDYPKITGQPPYEYVTIHRVDKSKEVIALNQNYSIIGKKDVRKDIGTQTVSIKMNISDLDVNTFSGTQNKGKHFTTVSLRTITQHYSIEQDFGSSQIAHGEFRVFIDLDNGTASF